MTQKYLVREMFVTFNINGDILGVSDSKENAVLIFEKKYGDLEYDFTPTQKTIEEKYTTLKNKNYIQVYNLNTFYYK